MAKNRNVDPDHIGVGEAIKAGIQAIAPGLSLGKMIDDVGKTLKHMGEMGAHELAASLYTGSAFVLYPEAGQKDTMANLQTEARAKEQEVSRDGQTQERERGGRSM